MNFELAKELKDAGFPQVRPRPYEGSYDLDGLYYPSLSELIEACGNEFDELCQLGEGGEFQWYAVSYAKDDYLRFYGSTPEEAVAKLWLALNKKS